MLKLTLACFVLWQLLVLIYQFSDTLRGRLGAWSFYSCGLLPTWRMFGPHPVDGDYQLYYRTSPNEYAPFSAWQFLDYDKKAPIPFNLLFNPTGNLVKALREISQEAVKSGSEHNVYYQLLLNDVLREIREKKLAETDEAPAGSGRIAAQADESSIASGHVPAGPTRKSGTDPGASEKLAAAHPTPRVQFELRWKTPTNTHPIFSSHVHPY